MESDTPVQDLDLSCDKIRSHEWVKKVRGLVNYFLGKLSGYPTSVNPVVMLLLDIEFVILLSHSMIFEFGSDINGTLFRHCFTYQIVLGTHT